MTENSFIRLELYFLPLTSPFFLLPIPTNKQVPMLPRWSNASKTTLKDAQSTLRSYVGPKASSKRPLVKGGLSSIVFPVLTVPENGNRFGGSIPPNPVAFLGKRRYHLLNLCLALIHPISSHIDNEIMNGRTQAIGFTLLVTS